MLPSAADLTAQPVHALLEQRLDGFRRHIAAGEAGAARGDDGIDAGIGDPHLQFRANRFDVIGHDVACSKMMSRRRDAISQRRAGLVVGKRTRVGNRQHRDVERDELPGCCGLHGHGVKAARRARTCCRPARCPADSRS
mgnify:CR=1 FL=1